MREGKRYGILALLSEYEAQNVLIPFVGIIIRKEYELRQQCHFILISRRVVTQKEK
jgi:hypothetical protein